MTQDINCTGARALSDLAQLIREKLDMVVATFYIENYKKRIIHRDIKFFV